MGASQKIIIDTQVKQRVNLFYSKSTVELDDTLFKTESSIFEYKNTDKYQEFESSTEGDLVDKEFFSIQLKAATTTRVYTRQSKSLINFLIDMVVISAIIILIGFLLVRFLIERQFNAAIVTETYQIQAYNYDSTQFYKTKGGSRKKGL